MTKKKHIGEQVSLSRVAAICGVHRHTVTAWVKRGCPFVQKANRSKGLEWIFDTAEVVQWKMDQALNDAIGDTDSLTDEELRRRKLAAETKLAEIEAAQKSGEVATLEEFEKHWIPQLIELRAGLRNVPKRCLSLKPKQRAEVLDEIKLVLEDFAEPSELEDDDD